MGAHQTPVVWTSMREEPVICSSSRPARCCRRCPLISLSPSPCIQTFLEDDRTCVISASLAQVTPRCILTCSPPLPLQVLRLFDAPLENVRPLQPLRPLPDIPTYPPPSVPPQVITTGVTSETVEAMELALKQDLLTEAAANGGKILLHDEVAEPDGSFTVTAIWEEVHPGE
jgi:hypothetical protein